jgi:hypothetical protein
VTVTSAGKLTGSVTGVFGLDFTVLSLTKTSTFWENLLASNQLGSPVMSFFITQYNGLVGVNEVRSR